MLTYGREWDGPVSVPNLQDIETALTNSIDSISLCSVIKKGTSVIVNIKENIK